MITATQIRMARAGLGWNCQRLADAAGVHKNTIHRIERGDGWQGSISLVQKAFERAGVSFLDDGVRVPVFKLEIGAENAIPLP